MVDAEGNRRILLWSGLYPARLATSDDDGRTWSELEPVGDWGGIVVMGSVVSLNTGAGHYMGLFHDDGRFIAADAKPANPVVFTLYKTFSRDGGLTWSQPEAIHASSDRHLCEPGAIRSPGGDELAVLLRENARRENSHVVFTRDEGQTWTVPRALPHALSGDRHTGKYGADGRLLISFRSVSPGTKPGPFDGDWVAWVGTYDDLRTGRSGQYLVRLEDNTHRNDCAYPGVEILPDDTFVLTTYGHWSAGEEPYILSLRLKTSELDALAEGAPK